MEADSKLDYTSDLADNIYKLARLGVRGLAKEMGLQEHVVQDGVDNYFLQEPITRSKEVRDMVRELKESEETQGPAEGNNDLTTEEKYVYLLENYLLKTLEFMSWTEKLTLEQISSKHGVNRKLQLDYIRLFIKFRRFLGYGDGYSSEVSDDKPKMDEPSGLVKFGVGGEAQSLEGPKRTIQSSSIKGESSMKGPKSEKFAVVDQRSQKSQKSRKSAPLTQRADVEFGGEASFQKELGLQSSRNERVNTTVYVSGNPLLNASSARLNVCLARFGKIKPKGVNLHNKEPNPHAFITYLERESLVKAIQASKVYFRNGLIEIKEKGSNTKPIGASSTLQHDLSKSSDSSGPDCPTSDLKESQERWEEKMEQVLLKMDARHFEAFYRLFEEGPNAMKTKNVKKEMFGTFVDFKIAILPNDIIDLLTHDWLNIDLVTWFMTSLKMTLERTHDNKCDFLAPFMLEAGNLDRERELVQDYLTKVKALRNDKIYLAPYNSSGHWNLFILVPHQNVCYILDSDLYEKNPQGVLILKKSVSSYKLTALVNEVFPGMRMELVKTCNQQKATWECAYYVLQWMYDMAYYHQRGFPNNNSPWNTIQAIDHEKPNGVIDLCLSMCDYSPREV